LAEALWHRVLLPLFRESDCTRQGARAALVSSGRILGAGVNFRTYDDKRQIKRIEKPAQSLHSFLL